MNACPGGREGILLGEAELAAFGEAIEMRNRSETWGRGKTGILGGNKEVASRVGETMRSGCFINGTVLTPGMGMGSLGRENRQGREWTPVLPYCWGTRGLRGGSRGVLR